MDWQEPAEPRAGGGMSLSLIALILALIGAAVIALATILPSTLRQATLDAVLRSSVDAARQMQLTREIYLDVTAQPVEGAPAVRPASAKPPSAAAQPARALAERVGADAFLHRITDRMHEQETDIGLVSPWPWAARSDRQFDEFQKQAWKALEASPDAIFRQEELRNGQRYLRVAIADKMQASCVSCHNASPGSPRTGWKEGDVAGIIDVAKLVEPHLANAERHAWAVVSILIGAAVAAGIVIILFNMASVRRSRERRESSKRIEFLAFFDTLTGALNRGHFLAQLNEWLISSEVRARGVAIFFVDLDKFKEVNDSLGHDVGDALVRATVDRLKGLVTRNDLVGRMGGDEFVVAQWKVTSRKQVEERAAAIVHALAQPFEIGGNEVRVSASVGVVDRFIGPSASEMLKCADLALYRAKALGRNRYVVFSEAIEHERVDQLGLENLVRDAVEQSSFELYLQPICTAATGRYEGFEALLRLRDDEGRMISPTRFIPVAESLGLIPRIDEWVLREATRQAALWPENLKVAVNLSPANFGLAAATGRSLRKFIGGVLEETGLDPRRLELEITEGMLLDNSDEIMGELHDLREIGVSISLDDFGSGYSGLSYLWKFPFDKLKIDSSFISAAETPDSTSSAILQTIATLGRRLGLIVCAEGVETQEQVDFLLELGVNQIQGYFYGRPMPAEDVPPALLRQVALFQRVAEMHPEVDEPRLALGA